MMLCLLHVAQVGVEEVTGGHWSLAGLLPVPEGRILEEVVPEDLDGVLAVHEEGLVGADRLLVGLGVLQLVLELLLAEEEEPDLLLLHRHLAPAPLDFL